MSRRQILANLAAAAGGLCSLTAIPVQAFEDGNGIDLVTRSDLGVSIRRSVVRGAQVMDRLDGTWERLSDRFGLGETRQQQEGKPAPKIIPDLKPLDRDLAVKLLLGADQAVVKCLSLSAAELDRQIATVTRTVQPSFQRTGLALVDLTSPTSADEFNFLAYCRYKAYIDLFSKQQSVGIVQFKRDIESAIGRLILSLLLPTIDSLSKRSRCDQWRSAVTAIEQLGASLVARGLVASVDPIIVDAETVTEWCDDGGELTFSIGLDGEATLNAQMLLQEQGYRLYPNFCRHGIQAILETISDTDVTIDGEWIMHRAFDTIALSWNLKSCIYSYT